MIINTSNFCKNPISLSIPQWRREVKKQKTWDNKRFERFFASILDELGVKYIYDSFKLSDAIALTGASTRDLYDNTELSRHLIRNFIFDFAIPDKRIAIEIEGGIWSRGAHVRPKGFMEDCIKYNLITAIGWQLYRIPVPWLEDHVDEKNNGYMLSIEAIKQLLTSLFQKSKETL